MPAKKMFGDVIDEIPDDAETFSPDEADDFYSGEGCSGRPLEITIDGGRDILEETERALDRQNIRQGFINLLSLGGEVQGPGVAFFMTDRIQEYSKTSGFRVTHFEGVFEAESLSGLLVNGVAHIHVLLRRGLKERMGGHLRSGGGVNLSLRIVPIEGIDVYRAIDKTTRGAHLRFRKAGHPDRNGNRQMTHVMATVSQGRDLSLALKGILEKHRIEQGRLVLGLGTFREAQIQLRGKTAPTPSTLKAEDGYELVACHGDFREGVPTMEANLIDREGRCYRGRLINGKVKDLVELVIKRTENS